MLFVLWLQTLNSASTQMTIKSVGSLSSMVLLHIRALINKSTCSFVFRGETLLLSGRRAVIPTITKLTVTQSTKHSSAALWPLVLPAASETLMWQGHALRAAMSAPLQLS
jgi:hypothetical protein